MTNFSPLERLKHTSKFDIINFQEKIAKFVEEKLIEYKKLNTIS